MIDKFKELNWSITEEFIIELTCEIIDALREIHSHGIIHCDIKPENIMLNEHDDVQLIDFSYSRFIGKSEPMSATQNSTTYEGTIYYSARMQKGMHSFILNFFGGVINLQPTKILDKFVDPRCPTNL